MRKNRNDQSKGLAIETIARSDLSDRRQQLDHRLDSALRDSFPASDPTAIMIDHPAAARFAAKPKEIVS